MPHAARQTVLFVSSTLSGGGAERFVSTALEHLDRTRFAPELALLRGDVTYPLPDDVCVHVLDKRRPWHIPRAIARLARVVDRLRPDVVMSAFAHPNLIAGSALARARHRPRWLARISSPPTATDPVWLRPLMRRLYATRARTLVNAEALAPEVARHYGVESVVLPNATDFRRIDAEAGAPAERRPAAGARLVAAGRLSREKRFDLLLEALAGLDGSVPVEAVICGEGAQRESLERAAAQLPGHVRLRLPGFVDNPFAWMASADLFVLSSDVEGLPNALVEAQGLGIPAVATDCPTGPGEIVAHASTGLLVPRGDAAALRRAIAELLAAPDRRAAMGRAARQRARDRYSVEAVMPRLESLLDADEDTRAKVSR